jgi:hypothetical protein
MLSVWLRHHILLIELNKVGTFEFSCGGNIGVNRFPMMCSGFISPGQLVISLPENKPGKRAA